jgi:hypothetical protein
MGSESVSVNSDSDPISNFYPLAEAGVLHARGGVMAAMDALRAAEAPRMAVAA